MTTEQETIRRGLRKLPKEEQDILIEEARRQDTVMTGFRRKRIDRNDADPMTIYDEGLTA
jgi:Arc/MetJ-type ribon-helix-helix transcriptional regulator